MRYQIALIVVSGMVLAFLPCVHAESTESAESDPLTSSFYGIAGDDLIGMGVGYFAAGTYVGLEWYAKDTLEEDIGSYGYCDKSGRNFTIALTPGTVEYHGKTRYIFNAILGYYEADYIDTCASPLESDDSGFDYGVGVSMSVMVQPNFGYILGIRYTDGSGAGITFGISW